MGRKEAIALDEERRNNEARLKGLIRIISPLLLLPNDGALAFAIATRLSNEFPYGRSNNFLPDQMAPLISNLNAKQLCDWIAKKENKEELLKFARGYL